MHWGRPDLRELNVTEVMKGSRSWLTFRNTLCQVCHWAYHRRQLLYHGSPLDPSNSRQRMNMKSKFVPSQFGVLSCFLVLFSMSSSGVLGKMGKDRPVSSSHLGAPSEGFLNYATQNPHHTPFTETEEEDQHLQFMLSMYRMAAETDGRPRTHKVFGSNTVRLLRPAVQKRSLVASKGKFCAWLWSVMEMQGEGFFKSAKRFGCLLENIGWLIWWWIWVLQNMWRGVHF